MRIFLSEVGKEKRELSRRAVKEFNIKVRTLIPEEKLQDFFSVVKDINEIVDDPNLFNKVAEEISNEFASNGVLNNV